MERKGVYRKGSAGHVRNVGSYRLARQNFKKWRVPLTALLALMFVFGTAPVVGEEFQASLLTAEQTERFSQADSEELRKALLGAIKTFVADCDRFLLDECVTQGDRLMSQIVSSPKGEVIKYIAAAENFASQFEGSVALHACKFDLGNVLVQSKKTSGTVEEFLGKYGDMLDPVQYGAFENHLHSGISELKKLVEFCENSLGK